MNRSPNHDSTGPLYTAADEAREEAITARAAEILADTNELMNAAGSDDKIAAALCEVARLCMDRTGWGWNAEHGRIAPFALLPATTALRAAIYEHAEREWDKENRE